VGSCIPGPSIADLRSVTLERIGLNRRRHGADYTLCRG
jgi:hypothetical protein